MTQGQCANTRNRAFHDLWKTFKDPQGRLSPSTEPSFAIMVSPSSFHFFSQFPVDIQRKIFEDAFEQSNQKAVELAHVSYQVMIWCVSPVPI